LAGLAWADIGTWSLWGRVGGGGCIVIAEFGVKGLHFLYANIVSGTQLELVHRGRWVEVDIIGEGAGLEGECHTLEDHFLIEVWGSKGCLTETINERSEWFALFLSNAKEVDCGSLVWAAASEIGREHMGESIEAVDGVEWRVVTHSRVGPLRVVGKAL